MGALASGKWVMKVEWLQESAKNSQFLAYLADSLGREEFVTGSFGIGFRALVILVNLSIR